MKLKSLAKDYRLFANLVVLGAIVISIITLLFSYKFFLNENKENIRNSAIKIDREISEAFSYVENITSFVANQIAEGKSDKKSIATVLLNTRPKIDENKYNIFTWTLFDFIDPSDRVIASSMHGVLDNPVLITQDQRSWIADAKKAPGKLLFSKIDTGIISKEQIIPVGYGVTNKNGEYLGIISFGINVQKFRKKLELELPPESHIPVFVILDQNKNPIFFSGNFVGAKDFQISTELQNLDTPGFVKIGDDEFYFNPNPTYNLATLVGINKNSFFSRLRSDFSPKLLNIFYLTIFFLTLLHFFRVRLLNPVFNLSQSANKISQGETNIYVPQSDIDEINSLANSIELVRSFVEKQNSEKQRLSKEKTRAEEENQNKTEFLSSTVHELKNIVAGITGLAEIVHQNFADKKAAGTRSFTVGEVAENQIFLEDIVKLSEELTEFIHDIIDVNQAKTGDFKIEEQPSVDLQDLVLRAIKLLKIRAIKNKKNITTTFDKQKDEDFTVTNLDPRRVKQILVNLISNSIKYAAQDTKIEIRLEKIGNEAAVSIRDTLLNNIRQNQEITDEQKQHLMQIMKKSRPSVILTVKDSGEGMSAEEVAIAMEKYGRIKNKNSDFIDSTGLGLPIVKHLVEMQGGMMILSSQKNVGTEVRIFF